MADLYTDSSGVTITTLIPTYYNRIWVERLEKNLVYDKYGQQASIPTNEGSSMTWHQLVNPGQGYSLSETAVAGTSVVSTRKVSAVVSWYGDLRNITTRVEVTAVNNIVKETVAALGYGAALTKDSHIADQIGFGSAASTGVVDATSVTLPSCNTQGFPLFDGNTQTEYWARTALQNGKFSSTPTIAHVRSAVRVLRTLDAQPFDDGLYRGVIHPLMSQYLRADSNFATWINKMSTTLGNRVVQILEYRLKARSSQDRSANYDYSALERLTRAA